MFCNKLVAPSSVRDPVTAFDVSVDRGFLITGTVSGRISAWHIVQATKAAGYEGDNDKAGGTDDNDDEDEETEWVEPGKRKKKKKKKKKQQQNNDGAAEKDEDDNNNSNDDDDDYDDDDDIKEDRVEHLYDSGEDNDTLGLTERDDNHSTEADKEMPVVAVPDKGPEDSGVPSVREKALETPGETASEVPADAPLQHRFDTQTQKEMGVNPEYICKIIQSYSDDGIRGIHIKNEAFMCAVGDEYVLKFDNIRSAKERKIKSKDSCYMSGAHDCSIVYCQDSARLVIAATMYEELLTMNLRTLKQEVHAKVKVEKRTVPIHLDDTFYLSLALTSTTKPPPQANEETKEDALKPASAPVEDAKVLTVQRISTGEIINSFKFSVSKNHYFGFRVLEGKALVHCSKANYIKIWNLFDSRRPIYNFPAHKQGKIIAMQTVMLKGAWNRAQRSSVRKKNAAAVQVTTKMVDAALENYFVVTIGSDKKLKIWKRDNLVCKVVNLLGTFNMGYPVIIRVYRNMIFYSCDDGIYMVSLPKTLVTRTAGKVEFR